jgi:hypothetical protein
VPVIAWVLCATAQSEQAAVTMAELWGERSEWFEDEAAAFRARYRLP